MAIDLSAIEQQYIVAQHNYDESDEAYVSGQNVPVLIAEVKRLQGILAARQPITFPAHAASLSLTHNEHKDYYETVEKWEAGLKAAANADGAGPVEFGWVSVEQRQKAIETDSVWVLHWYPHTPVGFNRLFACDLDVLLAAANAS